MPEWVIVGEDEHGVPMVVMSWPFVFKLAPIAEAKTRELEIAVFPDRWAAKRVLRRRNEWRNFRCVRREKL